VSDLPLCPLRETDYTSRMTCFPKTSCRLRVTMYLEDVSYDQEEGT
jgi:hypothetical protein